MYKLFEDTQSDNHNTYIGQRQTKQWPTENGQIMIYKTLLRNLMIEQHEPQ